jgi:aminoacrylate hydrolase
MSLSLSRPDGARLCYRVTGTGPDLMLISGLGGTAAFWDPLIAALGAAQRIITLDQRGIGASSRGTGPLTIDTLAEDCLAVLDAVGSERAALVGHSTGGVIAQSMGLMAPDRVSGLALTGTWARADRCGRHPRSTPSRRCSSAIRRSGCATTGRRSMRRSRARP